MAIKISNNIEAKDTISTTISMPPPTFLGRDGEWWDFWLVISVIFAAIAAVAVGLSTAGSVVSHKREAKRSSDELEKYKIDTSLDISNANARALEAQLTLEEYKQPRKLELSKIDAAQKKFNASRIKNIALYLVGEASEINNIAEQMSLVLNQSGISAKKWTWVGGASANGIIVLTRSGADISFKQSAESIVSGFSELGLRIEHSEWPADWINFGGFIFGADAERAKEADIRIVIGPKN